MKSIRFAMVLLLSVCLYQIVSAQSSKKNEKAVEWEYARVDNPDDRRLNLYAKQGWEIVTAVGIGEDRNKFFYVYMKRDKSHPLFGIAFKYGYENDEPKSSTCDLTPDKAPIIRGLRLNMTQEELFALFPGGDGESEKKSVLQRAESDGYGATSLDFRPANYVTREQFQSIEGISVTIFDKKMVKIYLNYNFIKSGLENAEQRIEIFSKQFNLPGVKDWGISGSKSSGQLTCNGFSISISGGSIGLIGQSSDEKVKERRAAAMAKLREGVKF